jgi:hypothetical protein
MAPTARPTPLEGSADRGLKTRSLSIEQFCGLLRWRRSGDSNSRSPVSSARGQEAVGRATCGFAELPVSAPARCCPLFTCRLRTQHGPTGVPGPVWSRTPPAPRSSATRDRSPAGHGKVDPSRDPLHAIYGPAAPPRPIWLLNCNADCPLGAVVDRCCSHGRRLQDGPGSPCGTGWPTLTGCAGRQGGTSTPRREASLDRRAGDRPARVGPPRCHQRRWRKSPIRTARRRARHAPQ